MYGLHKVAEHGKEYHACELSMSDSSGTADECDLREGAEHSEQQVCVELSFF